MKLRNLSTLQLALGVSVLVHAALLTIRFAPPDVLERVFRDTPLEVILVNARSDVAVERPLAIAQTNMAGGGDAERGRATSPMPSTLLSDMGDTVDEDARARMRRLQKQQTMLLAQVRQQLARLPVPDPKNDSATPEQAAQEEKRRLLIKQLAEIERKVERESQRPRKRFIGPSTKEEVYAVYYDKMRRSIEEKGTRNFPTSRGKKLYGELTMAITVDRRGHVVSTEIIVSSGDRTLDRRAEAIARNAGPFGRFPAEVRKQYDQIEVSSQFRFSRNETLETRVSAQ